MAGNRPFIYRALDSPQDTTRLLCLHPGQFADTICVTVTHEPYQKDTSIPYECLSYTWGNTADQEYIHVWQDAAQEPALLRCRFNLVTALRHLRHPHEHRMMWADAICINQDNIPEKSLSVGHMGEIYKRAAQVVAWIGQEDQGTTMAMALIERLSSGITLPWHHRTCETVAGSEASIVEHRISESTIKSEDWISLNELILRPYFKRLWVRQEVQLASKVVMKCGIHEVEWEKVEKVMIFLEQKVPRLHFTTSDIVRCRSLFPYYGSDSMTNALNRSSLCECTDARDYVYANLSTSSATKALDVAPDYALSIAEIYKDLTIKYVQRFQDLNVSRMCDLDSLPLGFMSFVPNFGTPKSESSHLSVYAHAGTRQPFSLQADGSAGVKGRLIDTIRIVSQARKPLVRGGPTGGNHLEIVKTYHQWEPENLMTCSTYPSGGSLLDAYVMLLSNGSIIEVYGSSHLQTGPESKASFLAAFSSNGNIDRIHDPQHESYLRQLTSDRRPENFFQTEQGYLGTSSSQVQEGDIVVVLLGLSVPLILRPSKERQDAHQVVGPCYLQGVMFGEALLGPLPNDWTFSLDGCRTWCFRRQGSDDLEREDPRLWSMPSGWITRYDSFDEEQGTSGERSGLDNQTAANGSERWFFNTDTKERRRTDPRLDIQGLESGGVSLDHFLLI